jgi:hypothetical protein
MGEGFEMMDYESRTEEIDARHFAEVLRKIAHGRTDNGRPLNSETARQMARTVLIDRGGYTWTPDEEEPK